MDALHLHLIINHLPVIGSLLGTLVLLFAWLTKNNNTFLAAYFLLILSAAGAAVANESGEEAEERVEHLPGFDKQLIHDHEEAAEAAMGAMIALGAMSVVAAFFLYRNSNPAWMTPVVLIAAVIAFALAARAGNLGGKIRHTELTLPAQGNPESNHDD